MFGLRLDPCDTLTDLLLVKVNMDIRLCQDSVCPTERLLVVELLVRLQ